MTLNIEMFYLEVAENPSPRERVGRDRSRQPLNCLCKITLMKGVIPQIGGQLVSLDLRQSVVPERSPPALGLASREINDKRSGAGDLLEEEGAAWCSGDCRDGSD